MSALGALNGYLLHMAGSSHLAHTCNDGNTGACCLSDGSCQILTQAACLAISGATFMGEGVSCSPLPCDPPIEQGLACRGVAMPAYVTVSIPAVEFCPPTAPCAVCLNGSVYVCKQRAVTFVDAGGTTWTGGKPCEYAWGFNIDCGGVQKYTRCTVVFGASSVVVNATSLFFLRLSFPGGVPTCNVQDNGGWTGSTSTVGVGGLASGGSINVPSDNSACGVSGQAYSGFGTTATVTGGP